MLPVHSKINGEDFWSSRFSVSSSVLGRCDNFSTSVEQHLQRLELVSQHLQKENLEAKLNKCCFFQKQVKHLGQVVSADGVVTDTDKIAAVAKWKCSENDKELKSFLGFVSYYRQFVPGFAQIASQLNSLAAKLTSKGKRSKTSIKPHWTEVCDSLPDTQTQTYHNHNAILCWL